MRILPKLVIGIAIILSFLVFIPQHAQAQTPPLQAPPASQPSGLWYTVVAAGTTEGYPTPDAACRRQFERYAGRRSIYQPPVRHTATRYGCQWIKIGLGSYPSTVNLYCTNGASVVLNSGTCIGPQEVAPEPDCACPDPGAPVAASPQPKIGNPILLSTGAKVDTETDYETADGLLKVERSYRSRQRGRFHSADHEMPGFGEHWHGIVPARLLVVENSATMELHNEAGSIDYFSQANTNGNDFSWQQNGISRRTLSMVTAPTTDRTNFFINQPSVANGAGEVRLEMGNGEYMLFRRSEVFRVVGSLRYLIPVEHGLPNGYIRYFDYPDTGEYPNRVRDNLGRQLDLTWRDVTYYPNQYALKVISRVALPDGTALTYDYAVPNKAAAAGTPQYGSGGSADRLQKVRRVDSNDNVLWGRDYLYEDARFPNALTGMNDQNGARLSTYSYSNAGLVSTTERAGGVDLNGVEYLQDAPGQTLQNYVRKVTGPLGHKEIYTFQRHVSAPRGMTHVLKKVEGEASASVPAYTETFGYSANATYDQMLASVTDRNGNVMASALDTVNRRPNATTAAEGTTVAQASIITWHPVFDLPTREVRGQLQVDYSYDVNGQLTGATQTDTGTGQSRTTSYVMGPAGRVLSVNGPRAPDAQGRDDIVTMAYDSFGNLQSMTNALGHVTQFQNYDPNGRPQRMIDPNGAVTEMTYDLLGRAATITVKHTSDVALDSVTQVDYDIEGRVSGITRPDTAKLSFSYNLAGLLTAMHSVDGERIDFAHDAMGDVLTQTVKRVDGSTASAVSRSYDSLGRMLTETFGPARTMAYQYDKMGNMTRMISARGHSFDNAFDPLNRLVSTLAPDTGATATGYDVLDNAIAFTDAASVQTGFVRNAFGDVLSETSPDRGTSSYVYDAAGDLMAATDGRGQTIVYTRDILGRILSTTPVGRPSSEAVTHVWDTAGVPGSFGVGRLSQVQDGSGSTAFGYDHRGNMIERAQQMAGIAAPFSQRYSYDRADRVVALIYASGRVVAYDRDAKGRVSAVRTKAAASVPAWTVVASSMAYEPFAAMRSADYGNGHRLVADWGNDGRLASRQLVRSADDALVSSLAYGYDADDNITAISDQLTPANDMAYSYDVVGRLNRVTLAGASGANTGQRSDYGFDGNGNRLSVDLRLQAGDALPVSSSIYAYASGSNRLASITGANDSRTLSYDTRGNLITDTRSGGAAITAAYDGQGRLISYARSGEASLSHVYNGLDDRVSTTTSLSGGGTDTRHFVYAPDGRVLGEYGASANDVRAEFIWMNPQVGEGGSNSFGGDDGLGGYMPLAVAANDNTGVSQLSWVHANHMGVPIHYSDVSGAQLATPTSYSIPGFPGQSRTLTDLYYNRYRDYDPTTGRYIQADPIGLAGGASPYSYAMGNPVRYTDPTGEIVPILVGAVLGAGLEYFTNDCATVSDVILAGALGGIGGGFGGAATLRYGPRALTRVTGKEWSHAIPRNWVKKFPRWAQKSMNRRGGYNGSWVDPKRHYKHDPYRYPKGRDDSWRGKWAAPVRTADRIPDWLKISGGSGLSGAGIAGAGDSCRC